MLRPLAAFALALALGPLTAHAQCAGAPTIDTTIDRAAGPSPAPYPGGPVPLARQADATRCQTGDAAGCNALADYFREASRDEARARALYDRAADLERASQPNATSTRAIDGAAALNAFREHFRRHVRPTLTGFFRQVADAEATCMRGGRAYRVRRVSRQVAHRTSYRLVHELGGTFRANLLDGDLDHFGGDGWVWEVMFGGGSRTMPPWGAIVGYVDPSGRVLATVFWPEG